ncbi:hypothetical protein [Paenibacillus sp. UMB4589-SE434]|uniref:hypothetical protein n=1 Tax=Paenibacillus sp. UMB4589-SE434 TaxID=3046314 RepID=UPI002549FEF4|nr:hypothetical protein [Paenibacillus sp. UMB4589-SE434]MDK8180757.1 hypothetical protein [Paenibacillus sp. UMB4589-SE434]
MNHLDVNILTLRAETILNDLDQSDDEVRIVMKEMIDNLRMLEKQNESLRKQIAAQQKNKMSSKLRDALYE